MQDFLVYRKASLEQLEHIILSIFQHIQRPEVIMDIFFPFIYKKEKKKEEELQPLYIELEPPPPNYKQDNDEEEPSRVIIIEL